jgi:hypothetical protein
MVSERRVNVTLLSHSGKVRKEADSFASFRHLSLLPSLGQRAAKTKSALIQSDRIRLICRSCIKQSFDDSDRRGIDRCIDVISYYLNLSIIAQVMFD